MIVLTSGNPVQIFVACLVQIFVSCLVQIFVACRCLKRQCPRTDYLCFRTYMDMDISARVNSSTEKQRKSPTTCLQLAECLEFSDCHIFHSGINKHRDISVHIHLTPKVLLLHFLFHFQ